MSPQRQSSIERWVPWALAGMASAFTVVLCLPDVTGGAPPINDHIFHFGLIQRMDEAWRAGTNPRDVWVPYWGQGFPVPRYYQHLPHLVVVALHHLIPVGTLRDVFLGFHLVVLGALPFSVLVGARLAGLSTLAAGLGALCVPLLDADPALPYGLGVQLRSFLWGGGGLFAQEVAWLVLPLAAGLTVRAALEGRGLTLAFAALWATWLSHLLLGYSVSLLVALVVFHPRARGHRAVVAGRLAGLYLATFVACFYALGPSLLERELVSRSTWESPVYWDSLGAPAVLTALVQGRLLDAGVPVLSALAAVGVGVVLWRREPAGLLVVGWLVVSVALYSGRPTWGDALRLLPFSGSLPFHRFLCSVQLAGLLLAGAGLSALWELAGWRRAPWRVAAAAAGTAILLAPAARGTIDTALTSAGWQRDALAQAVPARSDLDAIMSRFAASPVWGRGHGGTSWDGGGSFRVAGVPVYAFWSGHGLSAISYMYHTMSRNSDLEPAFRLARLDHLELFDVRFLVAPSDGALPPFATVVERRPGVVGAEVATRGAMDVVAVDGTIDAVGATPAQLRAVGERFIHSGWHARRRWAAVRWEATQPPPARPWSLDHPFEAPPEGDPPGEVLGQWGADDHFGADVELRAPGHVVVRSTFHPGWRATVDGQPVEPVMLLPSYLGVPVPPGRHRVEVSYASSWPANLFWLGPLLMAGGLLAERRRRR